MTEQTVKPGEMRLYDEVRPALTNDLYRLSATTTLSRPDLTVGAVDAYFVLEGPRFALPATEVVAVHPPRNALGAFDEFLPQVVLGRRTLPWERDLDPDGVCTGTMALSLPGDPTLTTSNGSAGALHFQISRGAPFSTACATTLSRVSSTSPATPFSKAIA